MSERRERTHRNIRAWALPVLVALLAAAPQGLLAQQKSRAPRERREGIVIVKFKDDLSSERAAAVLEKLGATCEGRIDPIGVELVRIPQGMKEETWAEQVMATQLAEWAQPDFKCMPCVIPSDPYYSYQWHHGVMKCPTAWDSTTGLESIIIGIVDSGVYASHPDLAGKVLPGWNTVTHTTDSSDIAGHGTGVAGCAAASGGNGIGVAGVSWKSKILPVRVASDSSGSAYDSAISDGIVWAADHGAKVINVSMGPLYGSIFASAATYAESKGAVCVVASGNDGSDSPGWPDYASIIYVGATGTSDTLTSFSSYGTYVDCVAPGVSIVTTSSGGGYMYFAGTSASAPLVSGVIALIRSAKPSLTPAEVKSILLSTCDDKGSPGEDIYYGKGRVNAAAAVAAALAGGGSAPPPPANKPPVISVSASPTSGYAPLTCSLAASASDPDGTVVSITWTFGDGGTGSGASISHLYGSIGTFTATAKATDDKGATATASVAITVIKPLDTTPPSKPVILSVVDLHVSGTLKLTWKKNPEPDVKHYVVVRYDDKTGYTTIGTFSPSTTSITESGLVNGQDYYYFVQAYDYALNKSPWSDYMGAIPTSGP